jgi:hypothetical protein
MLVTCGVWHFAYWSQFSEVKISLLFQLDHLELCNYASLNALACWLLSATISVLTTKVPNSNILAV